MIDVRAEVARAFEYGRDAARRAMPTPQMAAVLETALAGFGYQGPDGYHGPVVQPLLTGILARQSAVVNPSDGVPLFARRAIRVLRDRWLGRR